LINAFAQRFPLADGLVPRGGPRLSETSRAGRGIGVVPIPLLLHSRIRK
jgi:hypothetical protein